MCSLWTVHVRRSAETRRVIPHWMILALSVASAVAMLGTRLRRAQVHDLGSVSDQWMAEQRLGQGRDPQR